MFLAGFLCLCMFGFSSLCNGIFFRKKNKLLPNVNGFPSVSRDSREIGLKLITNRLPM